MDNVVDLTDRVGTTICPLESILMDTGVGALVDGQPVAVFRLSPAVDGGEEELYAIDGIDPFTRVPVLSRGIIGSDGDQPIVASPLYKQRFNLVNGQCLDDDTVQLKTYDTAVVNGMVIVGPTSQA